MEQADRVALITGAGRRVGRAIALRCAAAGFDVAVHYRSSTSEAEAVADEVRVLGRRGETFAADLLDPAQGRAMLERVCERLGVPTLLVNNAAIFERAGFVDGDDAAWEEAWRTAFETNLLAPARLARALAGKLGDRSAAIVNIIDIGSKMAWPGYAHYSASKAGLAQLTRTLAVSLAPSIRVNGVSPGIAAFPPDMSEEARQSLIDKTPLGRPGSPEDIAEAVVFLATQPYTTGVVLDVDGGWSIPR